MAGDIQITGKTPGKTNTVVQALNKALAYSILDFKNTLQTLVDESNPANANVFIDEWEKMVGIPDDIFAVESTLEKRVQNVLFKITSGIEPTKAGIKKLATIFGVEVEFESWQDKHRLPIRLPYFLVKQELRPYVIYIKIIEKVQQSGENTTLPRRLPFLLRKRAISTLEDVIRKIIPATHMVIFSY